MKQAKRGWPKGKKRGPRKTKAEGAIKLPSALIKSILASRLSEAKKQSLIKELVS